MSSLLSEVESMDSLPFRKESTPSRVNSSASIAPSIEDTNENPDELRALRGQGRYFGLAEEEGGIKEAAPKCNNCSQRGHLKRDCPHVICTYCGAMDDHYSQHCSKAIKCANCNESGHYRSQCPQKWKRIFCTRCNSKRHSRDRCPSVWRVYLLKDDRPKKRKKLILPMHSIYCYNCGLKGHFGDDCDLRRSSRVPNEDGSAFSGDNLTNSLKKEYFQNIDNVRRDERSVSTCDYYEENEESYYDDYEYNEEEYDQGRNNNKRKSNSKKRKFSNFNPPPYQNNKSKKNKSKNSKHYSHHQDDNNKKRQKSYNDTSHPLDFPRNNNNYNSNRKDNAKISQNMMNSRYDKVPGNNKRQRSDNYKSYNSFKFKK
ncbi:hypothetical protein Kpol_538p1 [Vanderwaltozyma polyspora DSM 70294]|uniref:CCHC-type domain-containing protein n=1 Tax=Vanderwaltozyma polyspora (strain ATCC 22028 / DSM 70294 / BCRC 21397 / CBS 2163 / NBRC 10782 / NRRL Y-8283 / UCD 57-17) TaxID=436907 RepID=A7TKB4_VANPO|nr:uncharacterized protein Kpol_538p1 [Vanderwaltozyma polyspora DSM 70294]EDO17241.1 hypothetical protein Kpol_538p1 [Vanderwaltozyma polyspora DSM 70294]